MMPLSDAIRLGALLAPQAKGSLQEILAGQVVGTCALGAALHAIGALSEGSTQTDIVARWPWTGVAVVLHPEYSVAFGAAARRPWEVMEVIIALNDEDGWSRERIADWVEGIERTTTEEVPCEPLSVCV